MFEFEPWIIGAAVSMQLQHSRVPGTRNTNEVNWGKLYLTITMLANTNDESQVIISQLIIHPLVYIS